MSLDITHPDIEAYLHDLHPSPHPVLVEMEERAAKDGFPIIGPLVGRLCALQARLLGARRVLELGSGYGYSTAWFADAVGPEGTVVHTDLDADNSADARAYLERMGLADRVRFEVGDALETADRLAQQDEGPWDIVFVDIDKQDYPQALAWARRHLRPGGLLIVDNVLWQGRVLDPDDDPMTEGVVRFTQDLQEADDLEPLVVPLRDGVLLARKTG